jgi:hypothetical protein
MSDWVDACVILHRLYEARSNNRELAGSALAAGISGSGPMQFVLAISSLSSHDQIHVTELVPQIAPFNRLKIRRSQAPWLDERAEQIEVAGVRLVQARHQTIHHAQVVLGHNV